MGGKASNYMQSDRPESGGADKDMIREKTGLHDRDQAKFAQHRQELSEEEVPTQPDAPHTPFSIDNPPNNDPRE
jgi:hypothetical protein